MAVKPAPTEPALPGPRRRRSELNSLLWLCGWGGVTAVALLAFAVTSQTKTASERLRRIFAIDDSSAIARIPPRLAQLETEVQLLAAQVRALNTDRDRLVGRIALLESSIDDMTGAIKKQADATAAALAAKAAPPAASPLASGTPSSVNPSIGNAPSVPGDGPAVSAPPPDSSLAHTVPLPVSRIATVSRTRPQPPLTIQKEFALDLGGGTTIEAVRQRWTTVKANFGPLLTGMSPLAAREHRAGGTSYHLVVGPLPNSVAAASLCAHFTAARTACKPVKFDGEQIAQ